MTFEEFIEKVKQINNKSVWKVHIECDGVPTYVISLGLARSKVSGERIKWLLTDEKTIKSLKLKEKMKEFYIDDKRIEMLIEWEPVYKFFGKIKREKIILEKEKEEGLIIKKGGQNEKQKL